MPDTLGDAWMNTMAGGSGTGFWDSLSTKQKWGVGLGAAGAVLPALFGSGGADYSGILKDLGNVNTQQEASATTADRNSQDLFAQVLPYLKAVTSGDRQAILNATMPERRRVIDQYSTAKKALAEFSPRSGGQAAAMADQATKEAGDLSLIGANARTQGMQDATNLGVNFAGQAQQGRAAVASNLNAMAQITSLQAQQRAQAAGGWGNALGMLAGMVIGL